MALRNAFENLATEANQKFPTIDYQPGYDMTPSDPPTLPNIDLDGNLVVRASSLTDEGGYRVNISGSSLAKSIGTATFVNGSDTVAFTFNPATMDVHVGDYVSLDADGVSVSQQIVSFADSEIVLEHAYTGTGGTGAASRQVCKTVVGTGASLSVASGALTLNSGTTATSIIEFERDVDVLPMVKQCGLSISQRIANQVVKVGLYEEASSPRWFAWFYFDGTINTTVKTQTARNATGAPAGAEIEEYTVIMPNGSTTATSHRYRIEMFQDRVNFWIDGVQVSQHVKSLPASYDQLTSTIRIDNGTTPASTTAVVVDYDGVRNYNSLDVYPSSDSAPVQADQSPQQPFNYSQAGVIPINTDLQIIDCSKFRALTIQCTSMGTAGVITPYWSNDGTNFVAGALTTPAGAVATTFNAAGMWISQVYGRYFRLRLTTATTGTTTTLFSTGHQQPLGQLTTQPISGAVTATMTSTTVTSLTGMNINAATGGFASVTRLLSAAASTNGTVVKASAGRLYKIRGVNAAAAVRWLKIYNKATTPAPGTDTPILTFALRASDVFDIDLDPIGYYFATGIGFGLTTGSADADTGALTAGDILGLNVIYA